jgi:hypothetical protein
MGTKAKPRILDFRLVSFQNDPLPIKPTRHPHTGRYRQMTRKQMRTRLRRNANGHNSPDFEKLYKPLAEWDAEELARGRPRDHNGGFKGQAPLWITREMHEEAMTRFRQAVRDGMNSSAVTALDVIDLLLSDDSVNEKDRPNVPPSVKAELAKWLVEQVVGKPKQHVQSDISVKLQGILASSMVMPTTLPALPGAQALTSPREVIDVEGWDDD